MFSFPIITIHLRSNNLLKTTDRKEKNWTIPSGRIQLFLFLKTAETVLNNFWKLHLPKWNFVIDSQNYEMKVSKLIYDILGVTCMSVY